MNKTPARVRFKSHFGQANHFLVTSLVGLHTLEESDVVTAPEVLRTSWNPQDKSASILRSRNFMMQSFLGWAVDSVDMYISLLDRKPNCLQNTELSKSMQDSKVSRSVAKRVRIIGGHFRVKPASLALMDVLITWRNNIFHEATDNFVQSYTRRSLTKFSDMIEEDYRGLNISNLADKAESGGNLTFKETASLMNAAHHFVQEVDRQVLAALDLDRYCEEAVQSALDDREQTTGFHRKYAGLSPQDRERFIGTWLRNNFGIVLPNGVPPKGSCKLTRSSKRES